MKNKIRFGFRVRLPFNLFPHAAIWKAEVTSAQLDKLTFYISGLKGILREIGQGDVADRLVLEAVTP